MNNQTNQNPQKGRKVRFNAVDIGILLLIIACIGSIVIRYGFVDRLNDIYGLHDYNVTFTVKNVEYRVFDYLTEEANVYNTKNNEQLGKLSGLPTAVNSSMNFLLDDGSIFKASYPKTGADGWADEDIVDITAHMICSCTQSNGVYYINGNVSIAAGTELTVYTESAEITIIILEIALSANNSAVN